MLRRLIPALLAMTLVASTAAAVARPASGDAVTTVRLAVTVETTSDWTKVVLAPGRIEATKVVRSSPGATVISGSSGWELRPLVGTGTLELEAVFDDVSGAAAYRVEVQKGAIGETTVTIRNTTAGQGKPLTVHNTTTSASDPLNAARTSVPREAFMGRRQLSVPRADDRRLTLAFYYPWFGDYREQGLAERPAQPRPTVDRAGVLSMTRQARAHGVDGFVVSWAGAARDGQEYDLAVAAAEQTAGVVAPYLETTEAAAEAQRTGRPTVAVVQQWLREVLQRRDSPAALKAGGESVVFVWDADQLTPQEWSLLISSSRLLGTPVRLVTDALSPDYSQVSWGLHRFVVNDPLPALAADHRHLSLRQHAPAALDDRVAPRLYAATVSPGYDDTALRGDTNPVVPRGAAGERYDGSWAAATSSRPDWVLINSWNEWFEGTSVEPGTDTGDLALRQTGEHDRVWHRSR